MRAAKKNGSMFPSFWNFRIFTMCGPHCKAQGYESFRSVKGARLLCFFGGACTQRVLSAYRAESRVSIVGGEATGSGVGL